MRCIIKERLFLMKCNEYKFGDKLIYISPIVENLETPCLFIRDDNDKAVVIFRNAEWCARVNYRFLIAEGAVQR